MSARTRYAHAHLNTTQARILGLLKKRNCLHLILLFFLGTKTIIFSRGNVGFLKEEIRFVGFTLKLELEKVRKKL